MEIHLGVIEQAYKNGTTVPEVAQYLEDDYGVMQVFVDLHIKEISESVAQAVSDAMDDQMMGLPVSPDIYQASMEEIQSAFRNFLDNEEYPAQSFPQVPTQAALDGVNHRLLHPYTSKNPSRPSFIDTGEYQNSFRAWVESQ
ncbi:hypothetical protein WS50_12870 [Burkholderia territorii]|uniref:hypothetical protein n=1 Tax=Burkholderia territorii TaxID=1503055 RepID=UPI000755CEDC|nr:hypothetical protein [Burkholderia territorii]KUZ03016.1 hypothetical protein WS47_30505 [Burkholderia territorii]KUZ17667.1 hypothetical protein WS50_12870 [Burkholderia territorii]